MKSLEKGTWEREPSRCVFDDPCVLFFFVGGGGDSIYPSPVPVCFLVPYPFMFVLDCEMVGRCVCVCDSGVWMGRTVRGLLPCVCARALINLA
jgi:hypothetical protein